MKRIISLLMTLCLILSLCIPVFAANPVEANETWLTDWDSRVTASGKLWQSPGEKENDRVFSWISTDFGNTFTYSIDTESFTVKPECKLILNGILNTVKLYDLSDGFYSFTYTADTEKFNGTFSVDTLDSSFTAMFCSDPQLGRSGDNSEKAVQDDTYGWERTLLSAEKNGAELILCTGDQVNDGFSLTQYNALFSPDTIKNIPFAPTAGNHDFYSPLFPAYFSNSGTNSMGNNYYFTYGNALFIVLDSNNILTAVHKSTIASAVNAHPDAEWRVVMMHHGAYSSCADDFTSKLCAGTLKSTFDEYSIDLVLSGHNHFYSRTYPIYNEGISTIGTVYFEAGSASGGKCSSYDTSDSDFIVHSITLNNASYSLLTFTDDTIEVSSYLTDTGEVFDSFTVVNTQKNEIKVNLFTKILAFFESLFAFIPVLY